MDVFGVTASSAGSEVMNNGTLRMITSAWQPSPRRLQRKSSRFGVVVKT